MGSMTEPRIACERCKDTGMCGYEKPMSDFTGGIHMIFVPQRCFCEAGLKLARQHGQQLNGE